MRKYNIGDVVKVRSDLVMGVDLGAHHYPTTFYVPGEHLVITDYGISTTKDYILMPFTGSNFKIILPEKFIDSLVSKVHNVNAALLRHKEIPSSGWCKNPSAQILKALNDQFGRDKRTECGAAGVAWNNHSIWKIEAVSSYKAITSLDLKALYFPEERIVLTDNTIAKWDLLKIRSENKAGNDISPMGEILLGKTETCSLQGIEINNLKGKEKEKYSLQEPMLMKKVDKKRKIIIK
jgi:hypothetical protein